LNYEWKYACDLSNTYTCINI